MKIRLEEIPIREITKGYVDHDEEGVFGYDGKLNIRPAYQREFVYPEKPRNEVINTVRKGFPLNVMYWVVSPDGSYELLDGQQRTISICQYVAGDYSINEQYFYTLPKDQQEQILDYKLMIYICDGEDSEKLDWFKIVNIAGEKLTEQELRNSIYTGTWLSDAKRYFSKTSCPAYQIGNKYLNGSAIRQDYLQKVLEWKSEGQITQYMADHQFDENASELRQYFQAVINWVQMLFPSYRKEMKGLDWGEWYNRYKEEFFDAQKLDQQIRNLMEDEEVENKKGIYPYLLTWDEKYLNLRAFSDKIKREIYEKQAGICIQCGKHFEISEMEADHVDPWSQAGKTIAANCQMLCRPCNRRKSDK